MNVTPETSRRLEVCTSTAPGELVGSQEEGLSEASSLDMLSPDKSPRSIHPAHVHVHGGHHDGVRLQQESRIINGGNYGPVPIRHFARPALLKDGVMGRCTPSAKITVVPGATAEASGLLPFSQSDGFISITLGLVVSGA